MIEGVANTVKYIVGLAPAISWALLSARVCIKRSMSFAGCILNASRETHEITNNLARSCAEHHKEAILDNRGRLPPPDVRYGPPDITKYPIVYITPPTDSTGDADPANQQVLTDRKCAAPGLRLSKARPSA